MHLTVRLDGHLRVTCGRGVPLREIKLFLSRAQLFIAKQVLRVENLRRKYPPKRYLSGDMFLYFGKYVPLEVTWTWVAPRRPVTADLSKISLLAPLDCAVQDRQKILHKFFRDQVSEIFHLRTAFWAERMGFEPRTVKIRSLRARWGSCTTHRDLTFNWKLIAAPIEVINYVVIHELAHLKYMDHSPAFWAMVAEFEPNWKLARGWLHDFSYEISVQFEALARDAQASMRTL